MNKDQKQQILIEIHLDKKMNHILHIKSSINHQIKMIIRAKKIKIMLKVHCLLILNCYS